MIVLYTTAATHIAQKIGLPKATCPIKKFSDGEIYVKITGNLRHKTVFVLASTIPPGDNLLELLFLLDALKREKAHIHVLLLYFGYARQDKREKGESLSAEVVCNLLQSVKKIHIIHMHSSLKKFLHYNESIPVPLYYPIIKKYDVIVAPDKGILSVVKKISKETNIPFVAMKKVRPTVEKAKIVTIRGAVKNKNVIIFDDMISTGGTIIAASKFLQRAGAKKISVLATHGIFSADAIKRIQESPITDVYVTNSIPQTKRLKKIHVIDLAKYIKEIIQGVD